jgi:hypothetical protein
LNMQRSCSALQRSGSSLNTFTAVLTAATIGSTAAGAKVQPVPSPSPAQQQQQRQYKSTQASVAVFALVAPNRVCRT